MINCVELYENIYFLLISGTAQGAEVDYVIFWLFILDEPAQALSPRQNFEILISAHKSLLINGKWKKREKNKTYKNFENKRSI